MRVARLAAALKLLLLVVGELVELKHARLVRSHELRVINADSQLRTTTDGCVAQPLLEEPTQHPVAQLVKEGHGLDRDAHLQRGDPLLAIFVRIQRGDLQRGIGACLLIHSPEPLENGILAILSKQVDRPVVACSTHYELQGIMQLGGGQDGLLALGGITRLRTPRRPIHARCCVRGTRLGQGTSEQL